MTNREWLKQEHKEKIELSEAEGTILENIDKIYKWLVRDGDDNIYIYAEKPHKTKNEDWDVCYGMYTSLDEFNHLFKFIKWEDEEPYNIQELLKNIN